MALNTRASLDRSPGKNWVEDVGGLPMYIRRIANHLAGGGGMTISRAIATAVSTVKRWCSTGWHHQWNKKLSAAAQGQACKAAAEWEAKKAMASDEPDLPVPHVMSLADCNSLAESALARLDLMEQAMGEPMMESLVLMEGGGEDSLGALIAVELAIVEAYPRTRLGRQTDGKWQNLMKRISEGGSKACEKCGKAKAADGPCPYCDGLVEAFTPFDGSKHPRGKPKNRGQFAPKGATGTPQSRPAGSSFTTPHATNSRGNTVTRQNHQTAGQAQDALKRAKQSGAPRSDIRAARARLGAETAQREKRLAREAPPGLKHGEPDPRHPDDTDAWNSQGDGQRLRNMRSFIDAGGDVGTGRKFAEDGSLITRSSHPDAFPGHGGRSGHTKDGGWTTAPEDRKGAKAKPGRKRAILGSSRPGRGGRRSFDA